MTDDEDDDFSSKEEFQEFCKVFDESDADLFETVRFRLGSDFQKGFGHNSIYNIKAFKNGVLEALERTRRDLSCASAEKVIDILYVLGYSTKRIIYIIWKLGYTNISFRDLRRYISNEKVRLKRDQKEYMAELERKKIVLFQNAQEQVLETENKTLQLYLKLIAQYQVELESIENPAMEMARAKRLCREIDSLQSKIDEMHGITKKRDASIDINKEVALKLEMNKLEAKPTDGQPQEQLSSDERLLD